MIAKMKEEGGSGGVETTKVLGEVMAGGDTTVVGAMVGDASAEDAMVDDEADGTAMLGQTMGGTIEVATTTMGMRRRRRDIGIEWQPMRGRRDSRPLPPPLEPLVCTQGRKQKKWGGGMEQCWRNNGPWRGLRALGMC